MSPLKPETKNRAKSASERFRTKSVFPGTQGQELHELPRVLAHDGGHVALARAHRQEAHRALGPRRAHQVPDLGLVSWIELTQLLQWRRLLRGIGRDFLVGHIPARNVLDVLAS